MTTRHDIWPNHLYTAKKMNIKTIIINANLYQKSKRLKWYSINFTKYIFNLFDLIVVPSDKIKNIFKEQLQIDNTCIISDTRFEQIMHRKNNSNEVPALESIYGKNNIIFGSISYEDLKLFHTNEKIQNISNLIKSKNSINWAIIVPHEIDLKLIKKIEQKFPQAIKYSNIGNIKQNDFGVLIVDKVGILPELYKYTKIAYVGGGFGKGVHSTIEPLIYNNIVCYGPNIDLLDEAKEMQEEECGFIVNNGFEFYDKYLEFKDLNKTKKIKKSIAKYLQHKEYSSEKIYKVIKRYA